MKTMALAIHTITHQEVNMSAFDAIMLREFHKKEFMLYEFYYEYCGERYRVHPKFNRSSQNAFFSFGTSTSVANLISTEKTNESFVHYVVKNALSTLSTFHLIDQRNDIDIILCVVPTKTTVERKFTFDGENYYTDIFCIMYNEQPSEISRVYYCKWQGCLAIEIKVTHKVDYAKYSLFEEHGIPIFEIKINERIRKQLENYSICDFEKAIEAVKRIFSKKIYGRFISNPSSEEYKIIMRYKSDIEKYKLAKEKAEEEAKSTIRETECLKEEKENLKRVIQELKKEKWRYEELSLCERQIKTQERIISELRDENILLHEKIDELYRTITRMEEKMHHPIRRLFDKNFRKK